MIVTVLRSREGEPTQSPDCTALSALRAVAFDAENDTIARHRHVMWPHPRLQGQGYPARDRLSTDADRRGEGEDMASDEAGAIARFVATATQGTSGAAARRAVFAAVRDLPYATNAAAAAVTLVCLGRGNCAAKAELLARGLRLLGADARLVRWRYRLPAWPPEVGLLPSRDDLHTAVEVAVAGRRVLVDATHDPPLARGGLVVGDWDGWHPTAPAYAPDGPIWREGADDAAIAAALAALAAQYHGRAAAPTGAYRDAFNAWLGHVRAPERA